MHIDVIPVNLQLAKSDAFQNAIMKYKEKLNDLEFYKTRVEVRIMSRM